MTLKLFLQAIATFLGGFIIIAFLLFLPAGTFACGQAWLFMGILFIPMLVAGFIMMLKTLLY